MATSGSTNWTLNRDQVITLALRRVNAIGQGETPEADAVSEAAIELNALVKELAGEGMPLWKISTFNFTPTASVASYNVQVGGTINRYPPLKILQAWYRNTGTTPSPDVPIQLITRQEYNMLTPKAQESGSVSQLWYNPPGNQGQASAEPLGVITLWNTPNASFVASNAIYMVGQFPFEDFDAAGDSPDFPSNWNNALAWNLAAQIMYSYGLSKGDKQDIRAMAKESKRNALDNGAEEGSLYIQPAYHGQR